MIANYTIQHSVYQSATDADGYDNATYGSPVARPAFAMYPQASQVPVGNDELTNRIINSLIVLVPDVSPYSAGDKVTIDGAEYRVSEDVRDWTKGPSTYKPGGEIVVERVRG